MEIKRILRFVLWISLCGFCGLLFGSKGSHYYQSALLNYTCLGIVFGFLLAMIFDRRSKM